MKFNSPIPQTLPKECGKASKIFRSFVDGANNGLDGVLPRSVLENAKGFAIFTVFKAGFLFSARGGSGIVIARLPDGTWSAPSAIGTAGVGFGGQAGAEMTDFLVVLNSRAAVQSFMSAGSLTLGGNLSIAIGPLGRNGEASGSLNTKGKVAAMYSYSKTRGLFGGVSLEGSAIVERSDANAQAYRHDVTARMLLSGSVPPPEWASTLITTLESCTGMPGNHRWVNEHYDRSPTDSYMFDGVESPRNENRSSRSGSGRPSNSRRNSYFDFNDDGGSPEDSDLQARPTSSYHKGDKRSWSYSSQRDKDKDRARQNSFDRDEPSTDYFDTRFESDFDQRKDAQTRPGHYPFQSASSDARPRSNTYAGPSRKGRADNPFDDTYGGDFGPRRSETRASRTGRGAQSYDFGGRGREHGGLEDIDDHDVFGAPIPSAARAIRGSTPPPARFNSQSDYSRPLRPGEGLAKAIALFDFNAVQSGDLSFHKGEVIVVTEKSDDVNTWWHGKVGDRTGIFPANFVEVV